MDRPEIPHRLRHTMIEPRPSASRRLDASGLPLLIARLILAYMFITMGAAKVADPWTFAKIIRQYGIFPDSAPYLLNLTAVVLPWLEIVTGAALLVGINVRGAALIQLLMLVPFTWAILHRAFQMQVETGKSFFEIKFDCGCGGGIEIIWQKVLKNAGLILLALYAVLSRTRRWCLDRFFDHRQADSKYCHICGYSTRRPASGVCEHCALAPVLTTVE